MPDAPRPDDQRPDEPRPEGAAPDAPRPDGPLPEAPRTQVPREDELARIATPATVRRAPRYGAFLVTGALVGALAGLVLALATAAGSGVGDTGGGVLPFLDGQGGVRWILALTFGIVGTFVGGVLALLADRRSTRRRRGPRGR